MESYSKPGSLFAIRDEASGSSPINLPATSGVQQHQRPHFDLHEFSSFSQSIQPPLKSINDDYQLHQVPSFIQQPHIHHSTLLAPLPQLHQSLSVFKAHNTETPSVSSPLLSSTVISLDSPKDTSTQSIVLPNRSETGTPASAINGKGITSLIRTQLNFTDPLKWKKFTNRRLELIDKFNLSSKKASEQDDLILKIADILRTEFGYKEDTLYDFDKLVRAAVQSVRRNRKRLAKLSEIKQDQEKESQSVADTVTSVHGSMGTLGNSVKGSKFISYDLHHHIDNSINFNEIQRTPNLDSINNSNTSSTVNTNVTNSPSTSLPSLASCATKLPPINTKHFSPEPFNFSESNKKKLLNYITNSSTFFKLIDAPATINEEILLTLGQNSINATISFILEKLFVTVNQKSLSYLYAKLTAVENLSLFFKSLEINNSSSQSVHLLSEKQSMNLLCKIVGCLIKDYGFDTICYTVGELIHELILLEYPLYITSTKAYTSNHQQQVSNIMPLLPLNPKEADEEVQKVITIKYRTQSIQMKFKPLSSTPPTYLELLDNCKVLFNVSDKILRLRFVDDEIGNMAAVFRDLNKMNLVIEVYEV